MTPAASATASTRWRQSFPKLRELATTIRRRSRRPSAQPQQQMIIGLAQNAAAIERIFVERSTGHATA